MFLLEFSYLSIWLRLCLSVGLTVVKGFLSAIFGGTIFWTLFGGTIFWTFFNTIVGGINFWIFFGTDFWTFFGTILGLFLGFGLRIDLDLSLGLNLVFLIWHLFPRHLVICGYKVESWVIWSSISAEAALGWGGILDFSPRWCCIISWKMLASTCLKKATTVN